MINEFHQDVERIGKIYKDILKYISTVLNENELDPMDNYTVMTLIFGRFLQMIKTSDEDKIKWIKEDLILMIDEKLNLSRT